MNSNFRDWNCAAIDNIRTNLFCKISFHKNMIDFPLNNYCKWIGPIYVHNYFSLNYLRFSPDNSPIEDLHFWQKG